MVLEQVDLITYIQTGQIKIKRADKNGDVVEVPFEELHIGTSSIDLHLGWEINAPLPMGKIRIPLTDKFDIPLNLWEQTGSVDDHTPYVLDPGKFVLADTLEWIEVPTDLVATVEGRSSYARVGLSVHQTAPWLHAGFTGFIALEIANSGVWSLEMFPGTNRICQVTFMRQTSRARIPYDKLPTSQFGGQQSGIAPGRKSN